MSTTDEIPTSGGLLRKIPRVLYLLVLFIGGGAIINAADTVPNIFQTAQVVSASRINANFAALLASVSRAETSAVPVGSVRAAILNEATFASASGDPAAFDAAVSKWALADGRSVSGSSYATVSGNTTIPDLRGLFLRGLNVGRADGFQDTAGGGRTAGDYQADTFASHNHTNGAYNSLSRANPGSGTTGAPTDGLGAGEADILTLGVMQAAGSGSETRSRNAAVYYYIRIN